MNKIRIKQTKVNPRKRKFKRSWWQRLLGLKPKKEEALTPEQYTKKVAELQQRDLPKKVKVKINLKNQGWNL